MCAIFFLFGQKKNCIFLIENTILIISFFGACVDPLKYFQFCELKVYESNSFFFRISQLLHLHPTTPASRNTDIRTKNISVLKTILFQKGNNAAECLLASLLSLHHLHHPRVLLL